MNKIYDIIYLSHKEIEVQEHFCREIVLDADGNELTCKEAGHGFSWEEARKRVIEYYKDQIKYWESLSEEEYFLYYFNLER